MKDIIKKAVLIQFIESGSDVLDLYNKLKELSKQKFDIKI